MNKIISLSLVASTTMVLAACGSKKTSNAEKVAMATTTSQNWNKLMLNRVGYITELNENKEHNYFRSVIEDSKTKYGYRLDGLAAPAYNIDYSTTRVYSANTPVHFYKALKKLEDNRVGLVFIENKEDFGQEQPARTGKIAYDLFDLITNKELYTGHMVIMGDNSQNYLNEEGEIGLAKKANKWKNDKIATMEFSEIISAYMVGYQTQMAFGKTAAGVKKTVGYIIGATYENASDRTKNMSKAAAFKAGILAAVTEQDTGGASFVDKSKASKNIDLQKLVVEPSYLKDIVPELVKDAAYHAADHSITYFAGATAEYNEKIANQLTSKAVSNPEGHKMVTEISSTSTGYAFEGGVDKNYIAHKNTKIVDGEIVETIIKNRSVTARITMFYNKDNKSDRTRDYTKQAAAKKAISNVLTTIFKEDEIGKYFGAHTYFGSFGIIYKPGVQDVPIEAQPSVSITPEMEKKLWDKRIKEEDFKDFTFLGWSEE